jgi:ATP-binding cassette subfamily B protein
VADPARDTIRLYRQLLEQARAYWPHILLLSFINLLATPIALVTPVPLKIAVDSIAGSAPLPGWYRAIVPDLFGRSATGLMIFTAGVMILIAALDELQSFGAWLLETYTGERLVLDFRARLFRHIQRLSLTYHDSKGTADSMYRLQYDAQSIENIAVNGVMPFVSSVLTLLAMLYVIARIDWASYCRRYIESAVPLLSW